MTPPPIHILLADDHLVVRAGLLALLSTQADFEVVGEAANGREAVEKVLDLQPDVLLLDLEMPEMDGVEVIQALKEEGVAARVIVFTVFDTDERVLAAVQAGAQGYLLKGAPRDELFRAVRVVYEGGSLLQPIVASKLMRQMQEQANPDRSDMVETLSTREQEVLGKLALGLQNKEIAAQLQITERTVKFHVSSILAKLGAGNRTEAVTIAAQRGIIDL
ncbi:MAG: response regulator transcription factor [Ardenticatenaceae bacterium]|nr:response regulator transcription factor [Ardenticatenaceae bacterium]